MKMNNFFLLIYIIVLSILNHCNAQINDKYIPYLKNGKWGYYCNNQIVIECKYEEVSKNFIGNKAIVKLHNKKSIINDRNQLLLPFVYDDLIFISGNLFIAKKNNKIGIITNLNKVIVDFIFKDAIVTNDKVIFSKNNNIIIYDCINKNLSAPIEGRIGFYNEKYILIEKGLKTRVIDYQANIITPYSRLNYYVYDDVIYVSNKKKCWIIDENNKKICRKYDDIKMYIGQYTIVKNNKKYAIMDKEGNIIVPFEYDYINQTELNTKYFEVWKAGKAGAININNKEVIPLKYSDLYILENYAMLKEKGMFKLTAFDGKILHKGEYDGFCGLINEKYICYWQSENFGVCDFKNNIIIPFRYESINFLKDLNIFYIATGSKTFLMDINGNIISNMYDYITVYEDGIALASRAGYEFYIDYTGKEYFEE